MVIPAKAEAFDYAADTARLLRAGGMRVEADLRDEKMNAKIRDAELLKVPYMLVVGPREAEAGMVSPRRKGQGQLEAMSREDVPRAGEDRDARAPLGHGGRSRRPRPGPGGAACFAGAAPVDCRPT